MNSEILELESYNNLAQTRLESQNIFKNHTTLLYVHTHPCTVEHNNSVA